jgi:hypothetical protein
MGTPGFRGDLVDQLGEENELGTMRTVSLMGWGGDKDSGGAFGHHCLVCGARFSSQISMSGEVGNEELLLRQAIRFADCWHVCS